MSDKWEATIEIWPFNGVAQGLAGPRCVKVIIGGDDINKAMRQVDMFLVGVRTNPAVWQCPVTKLERCDSQHARIGECVAYGCEDPRVTHNMREHVRKTLEALGG